jgi:glucokinase
MMEYVVGIDIGGTTTAVGLVDRSGRLLADATIPTRPVEPAERLVKRLHGRIEKLRVSLSPDTQPKGIGIGAPNANYYRGTVEQAVNLNWGETVNLVELFRRHYDLPVAVTNDANAAALGEQLFGAARGMKHFVVITLGTGLGSGIVVNGELVYGTDGFAGELGHTVVEPDGRLCGCGNRGCLEAYVSATGICRTVLCLLAERRDDSNLRRISPDALTAKDVHDAARAGDGIALAAYDATARTLGMKLADTVAHLSPEAIVLTGGFAASGNLLFEPAKRYLESFLLGIYRGKVALLPSGLPAGAGGVLGAAALIWHELDRPASGRCD